MFEYAQQGGGLLLDGNNSKVYLYETTFQSCRAFFDGGGIRLFTDEEQNSIEFIYTIISNCSAQTGGGIFCETINSELWIIYTTIIYCIASNGSGGGMYCEIESGNGGDCQAIADPTIEKPPSGFGGGIFLTGYKEQLVYADQLNLKGMKIYNNFAENGGQSLIIQVTCGVQSLIFSLAIYLPMFGFEFLSIFWLVNAVWLLIVGVEGIIYSIRNGGKSYKLILIISSFFVGIFLFGSMLLLNPPILKIRQSNSVIDDQHDAYIFSGIDTLIQSAISGSKIAVQFALDMDKEYPFAALLSASMIVIGDVLGVVQFVKISVRFAVHAQEVVAQDVLMDVQIAAPIVLKVILYIKKNKRE
ncbi:MAG: hypothetical protein EZS28_023904 [Streblomastix strix]|uniref:Transmembrane protein n=1 Tax=Streblomastix strix TaxID=222440 RepID=A0A5J4VDE7_9EUKA|nr:MAG: hypothetical protein EZS28_023904 [Streblomastix strix]